MNVPKRIVYGVVIAALATAGAVEFLPKFRFVPYVLPLMGIGFVSSLILAALSFRKEDDMTLHDKKMLMNGFIIVVLVPSLYTAGAFVHQSRTSWSGGEVHYHADFEVLVQRGGELQRIELVDPSNFCEGDYLCAVNDRTGVKAYHEHNDNRIHLEGVFDKRAHATLQAFFETFNGNLTNSKLVMPTNTGTLKVTENSSMELKVLVQRGVGGSRSWCAVGNEVSRENTCRTRSRNLGPDDMIADSPADYVISAYKRGATLDDIFIVYDSKSTKEALQDLREDDKYRGFGLKKSGEGY
ncbi:MAG: hypothetical protein ABEK01_01470 [Candidatus Nanohaloarchaea archaeon]